VNIESDLPAPEDLHEWIVLALRAEEAVLREEQSPRGLDAFDEAAIQRIVERALRTKKLGVRREHSYPGDVSSRPKGPSRERCDFVLTPGMDRVLQDPVKDLVERDALAGTLFEHSPLEHATCSIPPQEAFWLEVKVLGQHEYHCGVPVPNARYAGTLTRNVRDDLGKLSRDAMIRHGALLLVLFCERPEVADHDVPVALHRAMDKGITLRAPHRAGFPIDDRIGNAWCSVWLITTPDAH
jgi:hypothetical protein